MKLKGINPLEQHIEKIVLGVVGIALLGVIAMQVLVSPNNVDVGGGQSVPPDRVFAKLGDDADRLLGAVQDDTPPDIQIETPDLIQRFEDAISADLGASSGPRISLGQAAEVEIGDVAAGSGPVMTLRVPAPSAPVVSGQWGTLDPYFVEQYPSVTAYTLRDEQPYDLPTISVESLFDGTALRASLESSEDGRRAIPAGWWASGMAVLRVEIERSMRQPGGEWSSPEPIGEQFWAESVRASADTTGWRGSGALPDGPIDWDALEPADLASVVSSTLSAPEIMAESPYVPTIAGPEWYAPSQADERAAEAARQREIEDILEEIEKLNDSIARVEQQRQNRSDNQRTTTTNRNRQGGGTNPGRNPRPSRDDPPRQDRDPFETRIQGFQDEIVELEERLAELEEPDQQSGVRTRDEVTPLLDQEEFSLLAHDIAVQPGMEYRYRARLAVNNPLFGRQRSIGDEEPELVEAASRPLVFSDWSEWSESEPVDRPFYYFVKSGAEAGELGKTTSSTAVEVFQLYYGYYRSSSDNMEPGQPVNASFRLPEDLLLFDIDEIDPAQLALYFERIGTADQDQPQRRAPNMDPGGRPPMDPRAPATDPGGRTPGWQPGGAPTPGTTTDQASLEEDELPEGVTAIEGRLGIPIDAVLLDIAKMPDRTEGSGPAGGKDWYQAYFFDPLLGIDVRSTERTEAELALFDRLSDSAKDGENAKLRPLSPPAP